MGYTRIELLPVMEHPFSGSWGYQVIGFFAPTSRYGPPEDFKAFIDECHRHDIGVILDWVPGHFPKDAHGLARFDGTALYEHEDPRQGEHQDWGTLIFNYGRNEVPNFLLSNALFWLEEYHVDGCRLVALSRLLPPIRGMGAQPLWRPRESRGDRFPAPAQRTDARVASGQYHGCGRIHRVPFSHDEVVHGKRAMLDKMPGDIWQKCASLRTLYGFMFGHPGKKLMFMGNELGQWQGWVRHDATKVDVAPHVLHRPVPERTDCGTRVTVVTVPSSSHKKWSRFRTFLLLWAVVTVGCGGSTAPQQTSGGATTNTPPAATASGTADTCALLTQNEIAAAVGNPVLKAQSVGAGSCSWDNENPDHVSVLLIVHRVGSIREPYLCADLRKSGGSGERIEGFDVATWKFSSTIGLFNSGELEACGTKGFLSLQLNGKRDEASLKQATLAIVRQVLQRHRRPKALSPRGKLLLR